MLHVHLNSLFLAQPHRPSNVMPPVPTLLVWLVIAEVDADGTDAAGLAG